LDKYSQKLQIFEQFHYLNLTSVIFIINRLFFNNITGYIFQKGKNKQKLNASYHEINFGIILKGNVQSASDRESCGHSQNDPWIQIRKYLLHSVMIVQRDKGEKYSALAGTAKSIQKLTPDVQNVDVYIIRRIYGEEVCESKN
jgi:hypothetical protein